MLLGLTTRAADALLNAIFYLDPLVGDRLGLHDTLRGRVMLAVIDYILRPALRALERLEAKLKQG